MNDTVRTESRERWLPAITAIFVTSLIVSNIIAVKLFSLGPIFLPAGTIFFPVSYIFGDVLTEVYGYARARQVIWIGFACNLFAVAVIVISIYLPPASIWNQLGSPAESQKAYAVLFGFTPRLLGASFVAYLAGEFLNSFVLAKMKIATGGKYLWTRTIGSTFVGQLIDSVVFVSLAFYGIVSGAGIANLVISQWVVKSGYEVVATPLTYAVVNFLKRTENRDFFDYGTNFTPFMWNAGAKSGEEL